MQRICADFIDTDQIAHQLLEANTSIQKRIASEISDSVFDAEGKINRPTLREIVFQDETKRNILEGILHPTIRDHWTAAAIQAEKDRRLLLIEIPLLFETHSEKHLDRIVSVACPPSLQLERLTKNRRITLETTRKILASQLSLEAKMTLSDHVIWNDGPSQSLEAQAELFASFLKSLS